MQLANHHAKYEELNAKRKEMATKVAAIVPDGATTAIVAEYNVDDSDSQSDYFGHTNRKTVLIGWRFTKRESFKTLRRTAGMFGPTAHLQTADASAEHRENYSMGGGNYLKDGNRHSTGWTVRSAWSLDPDVEEIAEYLIVQPTAPAEPAPVTITTNARIQTRWNVITMNTHRSTQCLQPNISNE